MTSQSLWSSVGNELTFKMQNVKCYLGCHCHHGRPMSGMEKGWTQLQLFFILMVYKVIRVLDVANKNVEKRWELCSHSSPRPVPIRSRPRDDREGHGDLGISIDTHWGATHTSLEIPNGNHSSGSRSHLCFIVKYLICRLAYCKHIPLLE